MDYVWQNRALYERIPDRELKRLDPVAGVYFPNSELSSDIQSKILKAVSERQKTAIQEKENRSKAPDHSVYDFWDALSIRGLDQDQIPEYGKAQALSGVEFLLRQKPNLKWSWRETEVTEMVQEILAPYLGIFSFISRVKIHIQVPGQRVPFHRDLVLANAYDLQNPFSSLPGTQQLKFRMFPWVPAEETMIESTSHKDQNYYALKIPLTEKAGDYGRQTIVAEKPYYYDHGGNAYLLNEKSFHGAEACKHHRGLIFVDGILDLEKLARMKTEPFRWSPYNFADKG